MSVKLNKIKLLLDKLAICVKMVTETNRVKLNLEGRLKIMFNVGDYVTGNVGCHYGITNEKSLCVVTKVEGSSMYVKVLGHVYESNLDESEYEDERYGYEVSCCNFTAITLEEYCEKYPYAYYAKDVDSSITNNNNKEGKTMTMPETVMDKKVTTTLTVEETASLRGEIINLLKEYNYSPTDRAVDKIITEWVTNKGWMIEMFKKHPNYNGKFQIVFDADYNRVCDKNILNNFRRYVDRVSSPLFRKEIRIGCFTYAELYNIVYKLSNITSRMRDLKCAGAKNVLVDGKTYEELHAELMHFNKKLDEFKKNPNVLVSNDKGYDKELWTTYDKLYGFLYTLASTTEHIATEEFVEKVNANFPEVKAVVGQKVSRIVNKLCTQLGITKDADWNREFAKYSDAINPLSIKRHTILSCHPVDYLTMSFGNSWASCHTIDKENRRGMPDNYEGCYSSGTLSYMLDNSSFVFYTVDKDYDGNEYELQSKINRNMFHVGEDKLIQARVYPQSTDGEGGFYKQIREIAQKVVADCLGLSNMWKNVKGTSECSYMITSRGTHYTDYESFDNCNVSYLKRDGVEDDIFNKVRIVVGHYPICPSCGDTHEWEACIECEDCYDDNRHTCVGCDCTCDEEDMYYIDGEWYCSDCSFYCEYHGEQEAGDDHVYVEGYGYVCENAIDYSGDFFCCEHCSEYHHIDDGIETEDGTWFCCEDCASKDDYICVDGKWYTEGDVVTCEHCGELILEEDALETEDGTHFCDSDCASEGGYIELDGGEWYPGEEVHICDKCGAVVHDDDWNEDHNCCDECAAELEEEE